MFVLAPFAYSQPPGPESVQVPDIRANIMKMLQQGKGEATEQEEDLFAEAERQQGKDAPPTPVAEPESSAREPIANEAVLEQPKPKGKAVELPVKEIVIEDIDDLKKLAEELKRAKKRQAGQ